MGNSRLKRNMMLAHVQIQTQAPMSIAMIMTARRRRLLELPEVDPDPDQWEEKKKLHPSKKSPPHPLDKMHLIIIILYSPGSLHALWN